MNSGKIISREVGNIFSTKGDFSLSFDHQEFGPYDYLFTRESLYFSEKGEERGSFSFPLKEKGFETTEIFLERDDIVIAVGQRGSIRGENQNFIDIVNLNTQKKNRFFTDEVSLIYNTQKTIEINLKIGLEFMTYSLDSETLEEISKKQEKISAFFKLIYNWETKSYENLVYYKNMSQEDTGFFIKEMILFAENANNLEYTPLYFVRKVFSIGTVTGLIDVWESSIYGEIHFSDR